MLPAHQKLEEDTTTRKCVTYVLKYLKEQLTQAFWWEWKNGQVISHLTGIAIEWQQSHVLSILSWTKKIKNENGVVVRTGIQKVGGDYPDF